MYMYLSRGPLAIHKRHYPWRYMYLTMNSNPISQLSMVYGRVRIWTTAQEDNSPPYRFWSWWVVLFLGSGPSGELSWWGIVLGIVVLVGNGWALFLSGGELSSWSCPRTGRVILWITTIWTVSLTNNDPYE